MTKRLKVKVTIEWRIRDGEWKPAIFANVFAYVKKLTSGQYKGCYRIVANDHNGNVYAGIDRFNPEFRCFEDAG